MLFGKKKSAYDEYYKRKYAETYRREKIKHLERKAIEKAKMDATKDTSLMGKLNAIGKSIQDTGKRFETEETTLMGRKRKDLFKL